jgi:hypothetical protein
MLGLFKNFGCKHEEWTKHTVVKIVDGKRQETVTKICRRCNKKIIEKK